jgi:outer membrane protein insertion porin family
MRHLKLTNYSLIIFCLLLIACSGTKHLPAGEKLYTGAEIKLESTDKISKKDKKIIKQIAENSIRPLPNKTIFGMRPKVWMFLKAGENPKGKFKKLLLKSGEAPVLISNIKPSITASIIDAKLFNTGFFRSSSEFKLLEKAHTVKVLYSNHVHQPYTVKSISYFFSDDVVSKIVASEKDESLIIPGENYNLDKLRNELIRIDALLKNKGYFYFNTDYLLFKADTSAVEHSVTFTLILKDSVPPNALIAYHINNVYIDQAYSLNRKPNDISADTLRFQNYSFIGNTKEMKISPQVILQSVYLKKQELYSRENHTLTLNRLMSMGNFKFVSVKFSVSDTSAPGFLDATILMTPFPKRSFSMETDLVTKSNNYSGPQINLSLLNKNIFNGAESLNLTMAGAYEFQLGGKNKTLYSFTVSPKAELYFPRFLIPFNIRIRSLYVPKTKISLSLDYLRRVNYFDMHVLQFTYGFKWKQDIRKEHELNPIAISYTSITNKSLAFEKLLATNPFLKKSYEEQFITGGNYSYTYNEQVLPEKKIQYFFHLTTEVSGNAFSLMKTIAGEKVTSDHPLTVIGSLYSQYAKLNLEGRSYYNFENKNKLVLRIFTGVSKPYGNSSILPYNKQYFSGGPNGIRAFRINSIGPGTSQQNINNIGFLNLGGDVKLEGNVEYRFTIFKILKGALFADAGNTWLLKSDPANTASPFSFPKIYNELAVGAGIGLRIDVSFFILRFDLATPLRKPWLEEDHRWVTNQIDLGSADWRSENLILNVAIGYPF